MVQQQARTGSGGALFFFKKLAYCRSPRLWLGCLLGLVSVDVCCASFFFFLFSLERGCFEGVRGGSLQTFEALL